MPAILFRGNNLVRLFQVPDHATLDVIGLNKGRIGDVDFMVSFYSIIWLKIFKHG